MSLRYLRFAAGRALIHFGLWVLPPGRVRNDLYNTLGAWGHQVRVALGEEG